MASPNFHVESNEAKAEIEGNFSCSICEKKFPKIDLYKGICCEECFLCIECGFPWICETDLSLKYNKCPDCHEFLTGVKSYRERNSQNPLTVPRVMELDELELEHLAHQAAKKGMAGFNRNMDDGGSSSGGGGPTAAN